ncbi:MAG: AcaB family transcriptional regulator, partial [Woeseia sp.]
MVAEKLDGGDQDEASPSAAEHPSLLTADQRMRELPSLPIPVLTALPYAARPGRLRGVSVLTIKTYLAQQLVFGRAASHDPDGKRGIIGLIGFAGMLTQIFNGAKADDPYADKWLLDIEAAIDAAADALKDAHDT